MGLGERWGGIIGLSIQGWMQTCDDPNLSGANPAVFIEMEGFDGGLTTRCQTTNS